TRNSKSPIDLMICRVFYLFLINQFFGFIGYNDAMNGQKRHFMIIDFEGNPGLNDPRSDFRLSLEQVRSTLTRVHVFTNFDIQEAPESDGRLSIEFSCRAGLDMPGRMQRFVDDITAQSARLRPQNPIKQI